MRAETGGMPVYASLETDSAARQNCRQKMNSNSDGITCVRYGFQNPSSF
jgi:hypothetical protein